MHSETINFEQQCVSNLATETEIFAKLQQSYGVSVLSRAQVCRSFKEFSKGRESIEDEPSSVRPSLSRIDENVDLVRSDRRRFIIRERVEFETHHRSSDFNE